MENRIAQSANYCKHLMDVASVTSSRRPRRSPRLGMFLGRSAGIASIAGTVQRGRGRALTREACAASLGSS